MMKSEKTAEKQKLRIDSRTKNIVGCAFCIALGVTVPMVFHLFGLGMAFTPMHLPILLCGLCFGPLYGLLCGLVTPIISSVTTGMPPLYPTCLTMTFELGIYGLLSGFLYRRLKLNIYLALILTMFSGRVVGGIVSAILMGISNQAYGFNTFVSAYFITNLPGTILLIIIVPIFVLALTRAKVIKAPSRQASGD